MGIIREFFNVRILINCLVFAVPISLLCMWRMVHVQGISFFSREAVNIYFYFVILIFIIIRIFLFLLYLLARREEQR